MSVPLIPNGPEKLLRCSRCSHELVMCIVYLEAWCSCPGRLVRDGAPMEWVRLSKDEAARRRESRRTVKEEKIGA